MKHFLMIVAMSVFLTACSPTEQPAQNQPGDAGPAASVDAVPAHGDSTHEIGQPLPVPLGSFGLPAGVVLTFPNHIRADISYKDQAGKNRRHLVLEYLDGDGATTLASIDQSMLAAGYKSGPKRVQPSGKVAIPYVKQGVDNIIVVLDPSAVVKPRDPAAKGTITLQFTGEGAAPISTNASRKIRPRG